LNVRSGKVLEDTVYIAKASFQNGLDGGQPIPNGHAAAPDYHALIGEYVDLISNGRYLVRDLREHILHGDDLILDST